MAAPQASMEGDWVSLVRSRPVGVWRETLALLATYADPGDWATLCEALAGVRVWPRGRAPGYKVG
eukprot:365838-Chlamydomonas_euryale.AAC.5